MTQALSNIVGGEAVPAADGRTTDVVDPSNGTVYASAPLSGPADVDAAYGAAAKAFTSWGRTTPGERQKFLLDLADAIEERSEDFIAAEVRNTGKPVALTRSE